MNATPVCIRCGKARHVVTHVQGWWCTACRVLFDDDPDEGGDYGSNPAARLERAERHKLRRQPR